MALLGVGLCFPSSSLYKDRAEWPGSVVELSIPATVQRMDASATENLAILARGLPSIHMFKVAIGTYLYMYRLCSALMAPMKAVG